MTSFKPAVKYQSKLRLALIGPSGSGKTFTSLRIAHHLANGGTVAYIDTESGSASKYAGEANPDGGVFAFDTVDMQPPYHPDRLIALMQEAAGAGYAVLIVDSLSHFWTGSGGLLEEVDKVAARMKAANSFAAWKDVTPIHNRLLQTLTSIPIHLIGCMRSKTEYVLEQVEKGGGRTITVPRKIGTAPVQRDGMEFEFDVVADLDIDHRLLVSKTRCRALDGAVIEKAGAHMAETLREWLSGDAPPIDEGEARKAERKASLAAAAREGKWDLSGPAARAAWEQQVAHCQAEYGPGPFDITEEQFTELLLWIKSGGLWPKGYKPLSLQAGIDADIEEAMGGSPPPLAGDGTLFGATGTEG